MKTKRIPWNKGIRWKKSVIHKVPFKCLVCKKTTKIFPYLKNKKKLCSKKCFGIWTSNKFYGKNAHAWKGDLVGYNALHKWVQSRLGSAQFCEECKIQKPPKNKGKTRSYFQWANISRKYKRDLKDWKRLCYSCHKKYDCA